MHWSFTVFAIFIVLFVPALIPLYLMLFTSVVLHEYGHCFVAKKQDVEVKNIFLLPICGLAQMVFDDIPPRKELFITLVGPSVNIVLALLAFIVWGWTHNLGLIPPRGLELFIVVQVVIVVFNCLPAFPLDGGRISGDFCPFDQQSPFWYVVGCSCQSSNVPYGRSIVRF